MSGFDSERREWQFESLRDEHRNCCAGAMDLGGCWVNIINPLPELRGWDEPYEAWLERQDAMV